MQTKENSIRATGPILTQGAIIERLKRDRSLKVTDLLGDSALPLSPAGGRALTACYREYLAIGLKYGLPMLVSAPTWRAGRDRIGQAGMTGQDLNRRAVEFLAETVAGYGETAIPSALMGCRGDAYQPGQALDAESAYGYHSWQAERLARAGAELVQAATLPALSEAVGLARALAATGLDYIISFIIRRDGTLLDGTPLDQAVARIDDLASPRPLTYFLNCVHPDTLLQAEQHLPSTTWDRVTGLQANASDLTPEELDNSTEIIAQPPQEFAPRMADARSRLGLKILGGCCGTDGRHIEALARAIG